MELDTALGLIAGVLVVSALAAGLVERAPLSFPMLYLGLGFLLGDQGLRLVSIGLDNHVLRDPRIPQSVRRTLSVEAGTNDIVVLPILLMLIAVAHADLGGVTDWLLFVAQLLVLGPAAGFAVGAVGSWVMDRVDGRFQIRREYQSLYGIGLVLGAIVAGEAVGGDGFLAAFAAGLAVTVVNQTLCNCFLDFGQVIAEMTCCWPSCCSASCCPPWWTTSGCRPPWPWLDWPSPSSARNTSATASASPGSIRVLPDQAAEWAADRLRDQPFVLYCT